MVFPPWGVYFWNEKQPHFISEESEGITSFAENYQAQSRRPATPVPVFQGSKRCEEAEEEE